MTYFVEDIYGAGSYEVSISADYDLPIRTPGLVAITATAPGLRVRLPRADAQRENFEVVIVNDSTIPFEIVDRQFGAVVNGASVGAAEARSALCVSNADIPGKWVLEKLVVNAQAVPPDPFGYCIGVGATAVETYELNQVVDIWDRKADYVPVNGTLDSIESSAQAFGSDLYVHTHAGTGFADDFQVFDATIGADGQWSTLQSVDVSTAPDRGSGFHGLATDGVFVYALGSQEPSAGAEGRDAYRFTIATNTWVEIPTGTGGLQLDDGAVCVMSADKSAAYFIQDTSAAKMHRFLLASEVTEELAPCPINSTEGMVGFLVAGVDRIYVAMGQIGIGANPPISDQVWEYSLATAAWSPQDPVSGSAIPIKNGWSWSAGPNGFAFGGQLQNGDEVNGTLQFNQETDVWIPTVANFDAGPNSIINPQMGAALQL